MAGSAARESIELTRPVDMEKILGDLVAGEGTLNFANHMTHDLFKVEDSSRGTHCCAEPQKRVLAVVTSPAVEWLVFALIVLDVLLVIAQLSIETTKECLPAVHLEKRALLAEPAAETAHNVTYLYEFPNLELEESAEAMHFGSIGIISVFLLQIIFTLFGMGVQFFKKKLLVVDLFVVTVSLILDILLSTTVASLFILTRIWRLFRIVHGIFSSVYEQEQKKVHHLSLTVLHLHEKVKELERTNTKHKEFRHRLRKELRKAHASGLSPSLAEHFGTDDDELNTSSVHLQDGSSQGSAASSSQEAPRKPVELDGDNDHHTHSNEGSKKKHKGGKHSQKPTKPKE